MQTRLAVLASTLLLFSLINTPAGVLYVDLNSPSPTPPYTNWSIAATTIQDAADAASSGDQILVTNGIYQVGGRTVNGFAVTNRVAVTNALSLRSVNGAAVTIIQGYQLPGAITGPGAVRCVYLADGASLTGFTLTNGGTFAERATADWEHLEAGGGVWCQSTNPVITDCVLAGNVAGDAGGGAIYGTFNRCVFASNSTDNVGGGAYGSTLNSCTLLANFALWGGGGADYEAGNGSTANDCTFTANTSGYVGGGLYQGQVTRCTFSANVATDQFYQDGESYGGGASDAALYSCILTNNRAIYAGGADSCNLYGCAVYGNRADIDGGGLSFCAAYNCTLTGNSAGHSGGGSDASELDNCIVYYNSAPGAANYNGLGCSSCDNIHFSCTTPPAPGTGNISVEPQLADSFHLSLNSPCRGAGNPAYASGLDIDGEQWANPPAMGCDEYRPGAVAGPLSVAIQAGYTNVAAGFNIQFVAQITGHAGASRWDFADGTILSNAPYASHSWAAPGNYTVQLTAYNDGAPAGVSATVNIHVVPQAVYYVAAGSANPVAPYASWATAATNIQDAVDAAQTPGALLLVTNGTYAAGQRVVQGSVTNRLAVDKPVTVQSVNGPAVTVINGGGVMRCVYLANDAALAGFTLVGGLALDSGGGIAFEGPRGAALNCLLSGNSATNSGGGAVGGRLSGCWLIGNSTPGTGGGAEACTLDGCVISGNWAGGLGGGVDYCTLNNCVVSNNTAVSWGGGAAASTLNACWLTGNLSHNSGGGVYSSEVNNCTLTANASTGTSGGASFSTLDNCILTGNLSADRGGGAGWGLLNNCTIVGNSATNSGGGDYGSALNNCIVYYNTASDPATANYGTICTGCYPVNNTCVTPLVVGSANFTNAPGFVNLAGGDFHLQTNSPCINAGNNAFAPSLIDMDGNPRIKGESVDVGAYEFQSPASVLPYVWLQQFGLPTDGSADFIDSDGDGLNNWQEWRAGTNPTNSASVLEMSGAALSQSPPGVTVSWQSVAGTTYYLQRAANLTLHPAFETLQSNIAGQAGTTSFIDTNAAGTGPFFYRVGVQW
jgi:hypothetical protein